MESFDVFALNGSFITAVPANKTPSRISISKQPAGFTNGVLSDYLKSSFPPNLTIPDLLQKIEDDHKTYPNLYLTRREVVLIPGEEPIKPIERVQCLKNLLSHLFETSQVDTCAQGYPNIAISTINPWQKFVLTSVINHFHRLLLNDDYYSGDKRSDFINTVYSFFIPISLKVAPVRIAAPVDLASGSLQVRPPNDCCMIVKSPTDIQVLSPDTLSWPSVEYDESSYVDGRVLHLKSVDSNDYVDLVYQPKVIKLNKDASKKKNETLNKAPLAEYNRELNPVIWRQILWPSSAPTRDSIQSCVETCISYGSDPNINAAAASGIARVVTSYDNSFSLAFYATFSDDNKDFERVLRPLLTLFISEHREMQLLKLVSYYEINRTIDLNEMFRKNNNYIRTITFYINMVSEGYKRNTIRGLYDLTAKVDTWSFDHPEEKDLEIVDNLINKSFTFLIDNIDKVPLSVRALCRYLRLLSERRFRDPKLIFRANFALVLLRFIFPALTSPVDLGLDLMTINKKELAKTIQFTKLLAFVGQNQHLTGKHQKERELMNSVIDKNSSLVTQFFEKLCEEPKGEGMKKGKDSMTISKDELIKSAVIVRDYVQKNAAVLSAYTPPLRFENIYVDELLTEFVSSVIEK